MSQGAVFKLVLRDERFDKFFTASDYLRARLAAIRVKRKAAGDANVQPTFVDIERTHILYIHAAYRPYVSVASEYSRVKPSGDGAGTLGASGGTLQFTFPIYGHFTSDMAVHIRFPPIGAIPTQTSTNPTDFAPSPARPYLRYCALPGVRLFKKVELRSDQLLIDDYVPDDVVAYSKFFVRADQRVGWDRCNGQQETREATYPSIGFTGRLLYNDGAQTPKFYQEGFDMYIPLQFWFCRDAAHALLNDLIPNSQRTITCELAPLGDIIQALTTGPSTFADDLIPTPLPFSKLPIEVELYVNGLYVNPEIHDIFASRVGFSLIRVHRRQVNQLQNNMDSFLLDQLKFPAEYLMVGVRSRTLVNDFDRWWMMGTPYTPPLRQRLMVTIAVPSTSGQSTGTLSDPSGMQAAQRIATPITTLNNIVDTIGVTAHGIEIFPQLPSAFYNAYMPIRYSDNGMIVSPYDTSAFLVNFCLYPGKFNPSGYYNLSAGREMYINYALKPGVAEGGSEMVVSMSALNFLIRKGDKISLRYAL